MIGPDDPRHGTVNGYGNLGCRCRPCTVAASRERYLWRKAQAENLAGNPDDPRHGTPSGYNNYRCRCDRCREAVDIWPQAKRRHGSIYMYKKLGCRCDDCRRAERDYRRDLRARTKATS